MTTMRLTVPSPLGDLVVEGTEDAVTAIHFPDRIPGGDDTAAPLLEAKRQLDAYFAGELTEFDLPLEPATGGPFDRAVWGMLAQIPYGETWSYGDVAKAIGKPTSVRAVGAANGRNPIPIVVPCHRVIGANGSLTGFGGGLPAKKLLLELETSGAYQPALL
jgi:methylated-DNA-[protein]-cysteine S-methyltransferase